jgi:hypothetical protein
MGLVPIGHVPPAEFEEAYYNHLEAQPEPEAPLNAGAVNSPENGTGGVTE